MDNQTEKMEHEMETEIIVVYRDWDFPKSSQHLMCTTGFRAAGVESGYQGLRVIYICL